jgi:hypothetical protein
MFIGFAGFQEKTLFVCFMFPIGWRSLFIGLEYHGIPLNTRHLPFIFPHGVFEPVEGFATAHKGMRGGIAPLPI